MRRAYAVLAALCFLLAGADQVAAQGWGTVEGRITQAGTGEPLPGATVVVAGTNFGTAADADGSYEVRVPAGRYQFRVSSIGFTPHLDSVVVRRDRTVRLDVALEESTVMIDEVTVQDDRQAEDVGVYAIKAEQVKNMPTPMKDGLRSLKVLPGVATNNELSSQFSVHGGGLNENLIFINGFEIFLPFRPRQGEQEGLSLFNAELMDRMTFYTGGFPARYGGKLSSALAVEYLRPDGQPIEGSAYLSLLDAGLTAHASALDGRLGWVVGARKSKPGRLFGSQELKGSYQPDYTDFQTHVAYRLAPGHSLSALGVIAQHEFELEPQNRQTTYGIAQLAGGGSDLQSLYSEYDGIERDGYTTRFGGLRLSNRLTDALRMEHDVSYFGTEETEYVEISGASELTQINQKGEVLGVLGSAQEEKRADNEIDVEMLTGKGRWLLTVPKHAAEVGWEVRRLQFTDRIDEKFYATQCPNGTSYCRPEERTETINDSLQGSANLNAWQAGFYTQDAFDVLPTRDRLIVTAGVRADYFSLNDEWTVSPRLSARYRLTTRTTLMGSAGVYHQAPTYRELRGEPQYEGDDVDDTYNLDAILNRDLKAQRAVQVVAGGEHFLPERRFFLRAEAYYKHLTNLISYDVRDVRTRYSGANDARGYAYGLDLQLRGEFVPGLESWVNYSFLKTEERFTDPSHVAYGQGYLPRPADQRHTLSLFIQDYIPTDPTWKLHLRFLFGSGLPFTPPIETRKYNEETEQWYEVQVPGPRMSARYPGYKRVDLGATKEIELTPESFGRDVRLHLTAEVLNVFDMINTVAYDWIPTGGIDEAWRRIPKRLTPRTFNVRLRVDF